MALTTSLTLKGRKRKQPISFGGHSMDPRPQMTPMAAPKAPTAPAVWNTASKARPSRLPGVPVTGSSSAQGAAAAPQRLADDAQAAAARAQAIFDATQARAQLQSASALEATDLAEAVRRIRAQRPDEENAAKNAANAAGLASSGYLVKNLGDIAGNYVRREGDAKLEFDRRDAQRRAEEQAIQAQAQLAQAAIDAELADRQAQRDVSSAASGALPTPAAVPVQPAAPVVSRPAAVVVPAVTQVAEKKRKKR